jgi:hypothetical protein
VLRRVPAGGERQRHRERGSRETQDHAKQQRPGEALDTGEPGRHEAGDHQNLRTDTDPSGTEAVNQQTQRKPKERPRQDRRRDHQAFVCGVQGQLLGDSHAERAEQHPHHEAEVKIQERGE